MTSGKSDFDWVEQFSRVIPTQPTGCKLAWPIFDCEHKIYIQKLRKLRKLIQNVNTSRKKSLKSLKFTWQPAAVCISFTKSKNILTIFNYIDLIISLFIFHIQEFHDFILFYSKIWMIYLWFFMFYQWFWWIFPDFSRFFMFNSRSWMISYYSLFKKY